MVQPLLILAMLSAMTGHILGQQRERWPHLQSAMIVCWLVSFAVATAMLTTAP